MTITSARLHLRLANLEDVPVLSSLMTVAIRDLLAGFLPPEGVQASFEIMGLDTQLILDGTYFVIEDGDEIAGCGGWSRRATLFGGDHSAGRDAALLDPATDAARVRAMYTHPAHTRKGVGRLVLEACEAAARAEGFARVEMAATMGGVPLYRACGYEDIEPFTAKTSSGYEVPLIRMGKSLAEAG
ncbi:MULTISPECIES: GNAT family N-acetyltransferase [unclassified Caulobacter]|uniref:GNAT family N-acetyltransferase n=1 Tax=unclassified Caulobacter TaxID=2648921 RepID=UPI000D378AF3|nr:MULTISPECIES: GNAT family N-acetyltransferase [unclassified Caulobacter]PTS87773.1 GNAT family N-acetyltransferase [Caulobacter sp. HMWF009]PTT05307.1 GNAT family N-acetyltransferase [Caulobacter sp. HMWF025]